MMYEVLLEGGCLACAALLAVNSAQFWVGRRRIRERLRELDDLRSQEMIRQQRLVELSRANAARKFEVQWLTLTASPSTTPEQVLEFIDEADQSTGAVAAWLLNSCGGTLARNSASGECDLALTHQGFETLRSALTQPRDVPVTLPQSSFIALPETKRLTEIHAFPCCAEESQSAWLCLSRTPNLTGDQLADQELLSRLVARWSLRTSGDFPPNHSAEEIELVRDMLELRTLTDDFFESPQVMLQEFLSRLAQLTDFEHASVFRSSATDPLQFDWLATGGQAVSPHVAIELNESELVRLAAFRDSSDDVCWFEANQIPYGIEEFSEQTWLIATDRTRSPETVLVLSSRVPVTRSDLKLELAKWSVQFLPQVFEKSLARLQIEERARRDSLTRVANRHTFDVEFQKELRCAQLNRVPCSLLLIDVDHFKTVNDSHGHLAGDNVLREVAETISREVHRTRITDHPLVARYGGEEFVVLLPEVPLAGAARIAEQIRLMVETKRFSIDAGYLHITVSCGVACTNNGESTSRALLQAADEALYAAKHQGRNRIVVGECAAASST